MQKILDFATQGLLALSFLHKHEIAHGQITLSNVFIRENDDAICLGPVNFNLKQNIQDSFDQDLMDFGIVLYALAELKEYTITNNIPFTRIPEGPTRQLIISLLDNISARKQSLEDILATREIQERMREWDDIQPQQLTPSSIEPSCIQFYKYRSYLAKLLVKLSGSNVDIKISIAEKGEFVRLAKVLKWARNQNKIIARPLQEWVCESVSNLIDEIKDIEKIGFGQSEIVQELQHLIGSILSIEEVKYIHINALKLFSYYGSIETRGKLYQRGIIQSIYHLLLGSNSVVLETIITIGGILLFKGDMAKKLGFHSYFEDLCKSGITDFIYQNGVVNGKSEDIISASAYCLGWIYKSQHLPVDMISSVIACIKTGIKSDNRLFYTNSSSALNCIAWNAEELNRLEQIKTKIKQKNSFSQTLQERKDLAEDLCGVLIEGRQNIEEKGGLVIVVCRISQYLLSDYDIISGIALEKDGLVDSFFALYETVPIEQVSYKHIDPLFPIVIGLLHKAIPLPNEIRKEVILKLKQSSKDSSLKPFKSSQLALSRLAECNGFDTFGELITLWI
ncbi:MAG: hypothetical protein EZS28_017354 [Streblomastix strix]|uniref:Protein kinase domain-containing protein n=1 Tax=Streblomastix strix TaxID=222440 RepID=A0A5J4VXT5_9EUKA|nr:MAG: hypothetical protein EZS28_017354 [Streblomastix strix]